MIELIYERIIFIMSSKEVILLSLILNASRHYDQSTLLVAGSFHTAEQISSVNMCHVYILSQATS